VFKFILSLNFILFFSEKQLSTNAIYVGQLPEHVVEDDVKKLFPKANKVELFPAKAKNKGVRPGFAFVSFPDDNSAAAAIKLGPSLTLKNTQLKVAYQSKRAIPATAE
jgi:RNA recognition motif-containing protein